MLGTIVLDSEMSKTVAFQQSHGYLPWGTSR
jgi:hypothetical protein